MRRAGAAAFALLAAGCAATAERERPRPAQAPATPVAAARAVELRNGGFEAAADAGRRCPPGWDCIVHNHPPAFHFFLQESGAAAGSRSLCIERLANEPWAVVTQVVQGPALRGTRLRLSMAVRVEGVSGDGAGPWALVQANPPVHALKLVRGSSGWQRVSVDLAVPQSESIVQVGATLEGPGRACFDDVRLEVRGAGQDPV